MKCECGNDEFYVYIVREPSYVVDENGDFKDSIYDSLMEPEIDFYECTECGKKYKELK